MYAIKLLFLFALLFVSASSGLAQYASEAPVRTLISAPAPSLKDGDVYQIVQTREGHTVVFERQRRKGVYYTVFDSTGRLISRKLMAVQGLPDPTLNDGFIRSTHAIGNSIVLFVEFHAERKPTLHRVVLDPVSASVVQQDQVAALPPFKKSALDVLVVGRTTGTSFTAASDPRTGDYAVLVYDNYAKEKTDGVLRMYNASHALRSEVPFTVPSHASGNSSVITMLVQDGGVMVCSYTAGRRGEAGRGVMLSAWKPGAEAVRHYQVKALQDVDETDAVLKANPAAGKLALLSVTYSGNPAAVGRDVYTSRLTLIDTADLSAQQTTGITTKFVSSATGDRQNYKGVPQGFCVLPDGNMVVSAEEVIVRNTERVGGSGTASSGRIYVFIGDLSVTRYGPDGSEIGGYMIKRLHPSGGATLLLATANREGHTLSALPSSMTSSTVADDPDYYAHDLLSTPAGEYLILNDKLTMDLNEGGTRKRGGTETMLRSPSESNLALYAAGKPSFLFGRPAADAPTKYALTGASHFDPVTGRYVTLLFMNKMPHLAYAYLY